MDGAAPCGAGVKPDKPGLPVAEDWVAVLSPVTDIMSTEKFSSSSFCRYGCAGVPTDEIEDARTLLPVAGTNSFLLFLFKSIIVKFSQRFASNSIR